MVTMEFSAIKEEYRDQIKKITQENEPVMLEQDEKIDTVIISIDKYNEMLKEINNLKYTQKLMKSLKQIENGEIVYHDIIEVD